MFFLPVALFRRSSPVVAAGAATRRTAKDLRLGETGTICCLEDPEMALKLLEMGCVPGVKVRLSGRAPLGDPLMLVLGDQEYTLSVRASEAANILLKEEGAAHGGGSK
ncbi:Fe2+ transport system protein FeoA [Hymenobacter arizonensis]|uniref:Fe2+ transport system protein FeoA n=1 Tax=Hymenobacter arizonensis TaxID=1227077 RepID=A0A1I5XKB0_HYMAR|nr:Fe2+ transport system protein FeoA [Hymenobacter arizonensis]